MCVQGWLEIRAVSAWAAEDNASAEETQSDAGEESGEKTVDPDAVRVGALKGPTAMGMAQLLDADGYDFTIAASPDEIQYPMVVRPIW